MTARTPTRGIEAEIEDRLMHGKTTRAVIADGFARSTVFKVASRIEAGTARGRLDRVRLSQYDLDEAMRLIKRARKRIAEVEGIGGL